MKPMKIPWVEKLREILDKDIPDNDKLRQIYLYGVNEEWNLAKRWKERNQN